MMDETRSKSPWNVARRRRDVQFPEKREALLKAAATLFRQQGYEGASLNELAEALNITKSTLYYYFRNKDELLLQIKLRVQDDILRFLRATELGPRSAYEKLREIMLYYARVMTSDEGACMSLIKTRLLEPEGRAQVEERVEEANQILHRILQAGQKDKSLVAFPERTVAIHGLFGSLNWISNWYNPAGALSAERLAKIQVDMLLNGVRGPAALAKKPAAPRKAKAETEPAAPQRKANAAVEEPAAPRKAKVAKEPPASRRKTKAEKPPVAARRRVKEPA